jgi:RNA polymerase sigma factor (sigma-70 family)
MVNTLLLRSIHCYVNSRFHFVTALPKLFSLFLLHLGIQKTLTIKKSTTDSALIEGLLGSNAQRNKALRALYVENRGRICSYVKSNSGSDAAAKDVFQESIIAFYENVRDGKYRGESAVSTYLYSIAKFKWLNQIKKDKVRDGHHNQIEMERFEIDPLTHLIEKQRQEDIFGVLSELGSQCKELLIATLYHSKSMKDLVASGAFSSEQIVRNKKYKCLKRLKELIKQQPLLAKRLKGDG